MDREEIPSPTTEYLSRSFKKRIAEWQAEVIHCDNVPRIQLVPVQKKRKVLHRPKSSKSDSLRFRDRESISVRTGESSSKYVQRRKSSKDFRPSGHRDGTASRLSFGRLNLESKSISNAFTERTFTRQSTPVIPPPENTIRMKRETLERTRPAFRFLGCSGGAGKLSRATRTIGVGVGGFLKRLSGWCSAQGCIPLQFQDDIERLDPFTYMPELVYGGFANEWSTRELNLELDFVKASVQSAEKLHISSSTEAEWIMHTTSLLEHAFRTFEAAMSVLVTTSLELEAALLPIDPGKLNATPRQKVPRDSRSSATESDELDIIPATIDIAIGLDKGDFAVAAFLKELEATYRIRAPTAFKHSVPLPIIPVKVKDETASSLDAEHETAICASVMLASWSAASATGNSMFLHGNQTHLEELSSTDADESDDIDPRISPLVLTISVIGSSWYYNVVYADDLRDFTATRQVLGPFLIGQSRTFIGTFQILRFLRMACEWGAKEWVRDMCERLGGDSDRVVRELSKLFD